MAFSIMTWNVNGIRARGEQVRDLLRDQAPDLLLLQEIKASPEQVPETLRELNLPEYAATWHGSGGYSGVAVLARRDRFAEPPQVSPAPFDMECRTLVTDFRLAGETGSEWRVASIYVPNGGKDFEAKLRFLAAVRDWAADQATSGVNLLVGGDLNVAREERDIHPKERKLLQIGARPEERELFERILRGASATDLGRRSEPDNPDLFTWWAPWRNLRQRNIGWRIDYLLSTGAWSEAAQDSRVLATFGSSDHAPVLARFGI